MAKSERSPLKLDLNKFENCHQIGGIQTALVDTPAFAPASGMGAGTPSRVAFINTGSGLRFTVALDHGGDILDASLNQHGLAFLSPNGLKRPSHAYHTGMDWLTGWAGGLVTTCGPQYIGAPRQEDGIATNLHGHYTNTPSSIESIINPDPHRGKMDMVITLVTRDSRMFCPVVEIRRQIKCTLGKAQIAIRDQVTNRGNVRCAHHYLYHVNLGYPLLDRGASLVYAGKADRFFTFPGPEKDMPSSAELGKLKTIPDSLPQHAGPGEHGVILKIKADRQGLAHAGLINNKLGLAFEVVFPTRAMPRLVNWQHFGPGGSYVTGIEPFSGSLVGKARDTFAKAEQYLEPGESRQYDLTLNVLCDPKTIRQFAAHDGKVTT